VWRAKLAPKESLGGQWRRMRWCGRHVEGFDGFGELDGTGNLTAQVRNIADVTKAVANGDLSKKITVDVKGEILELKEHRQYDGGSAFVVRFRSDACGSRSWF